MRYYKNTFKKPAEEEIAVRVALQPLIYGVSRLRGE